MYIFAWGILCYWRGVWNLIDLYFGEGWINSTICYICAAVSKSLNEGYYRYCKRCLHGPPMQRLARRCDCCYVTKWVTITSAHKGQSPVHTVPAPAHPIQIRAHHHIDVYADINKLSGSNISQYTVIMFQIKCLHIFISL